MNILKKSRGPRSVSLACFVACFVAVSLRSFFFLEGRALFRWGVLCPPRESPRPRGHRNQPGPLFSAGAVENIENTQKLGKT